MQAAAHKRIYWLDILRAWAILCVMQIHSFDYLVPHYNVHYYWLLLIDGVDIFFVLSGFLIGGILLRMANDPAGFNLREFWLRRWFRTLPNYYLLVIVLMPAYIYYFKHVPDKALHYLTFSQSLFSRHPHFFPEAWSLAIEEWFYLLVPIGLWLVLRFAGRQQRTAILIYIVSVIITVTLYRIYMIGKLTGTPGFEWQHDIRKVVVLRLDAIMYGFLGAYAAYYYPASWPRRRWLLFITGLMLCFGGRYMGGRYPVFYQYANMSATCLGVLCMLPMLASITTGSGPVHKALTFISIISYSMYLLNYTVVQNIVLPGICKLAGIDINTSLGGAWVAWALFYILTIGMSWGLYRYYERPMTQLRERFARKKQATALPVE
jgi:peptidoglycan/LPS O-acetylase OafA/YrhL